MGFEGTSIDSTTWPIYTHRFQDRRWSDEDLDTSLSELKATYDLNEPDGVVVDARIHQVPNASVDDEHELLTSLVAMLQIGEEIRDVLVRPWSVVKRTTETGHALLSVKTPCRSMLAPPLTHQLKLSGRSTHRIPSGSSISTAHSLQWLQPLT